MSQHLPTLSAAEVIRALGKVGFREVPGRGKGGHVFVHRESPPKGITIPRVKEVKRGTLRAIIRQADFTVDEFLALL